MPQCSSPRDWNVLVPQGRATGLLGTLLRIAGEHGLLNSVPVRFAGT